MFIKKRTFGIIWKFLSIYRTKIKQQIDACEKAAKLEREIENWCQLSGFDPYSKEYKEIKGRLVDAVAPLNADKIKEIADKIQWNKG